MRSALAVLLAALMSLSSCVPLEDRPLFSRSRRSLTGETSTDRDTGAYPYPEEIARLELGMSRRAVYEILGEPMRRLSGAQPVWIYGEPGRRQLLLTFEVDRLLYMTK